MKKNGKLFWNCWRAVSCTHVDGCADGGIVVNKFAEVLVNHIHVVIITNTRPIYFGISMSICAVIMLAHLC